MCGSITQHKCNTALINALKLDELRIVQFLHKKKYYFLSNGLSLWLINVKIFSVDIVSYLFALFLDWCKSLLSDKKSQDKISSIYSKDPSKGTNGQRNTHLWHKCQVFLIKK